MFKEKNHPIKGMTLIELMLSLFLSLLILGGLSSSYISAQKNYSTQTGLNSIQENSRIIFAILNNNLRMAGDVGCAKLTNDFPIFSDSFYNITPANKIQNYVGSEIKKGSNAITIRNASSQSVALTHPMTGLANLYVTNTLSFRAGDILMISDCQTTEIFTVKEVEQGKNNNQIIIASHPLKKFYLTNAEIKFFQVNTYFIAKTNRINEFKQPIYALYIKSINQSKKELVENVEDMQIQYSILKNNNIITHQANEIADSENIVGVAIMFRLNAANNFSLQKKEYTYVSLRN